MLIGASLLIIIFIVIFNLVLGGNFIQALTTISIDNEAIVDGVSNTFVIDPTSVVIGIQLDAIIGAIGIITAIYIGVAGITGISFLSSGINGASARLITLASGYIAIWVLLSILAYNLIVSIEIFGGIIYVMITIAYVIGVAQNLSGGGS